MTTTLLGVDDSKTMRRVLEITFGGEDYRTVLAENSADALQKLRSEKPSIALVDAHLGSESGYDLCQAIKRESPAVPVVILSSKQQPYDRARGSSVGADDFMDKPFDTQQLIDKVAQVIRKAAEAPAAVRPAAPPPATAAAPARPLAQTLSFGTPQPGSAAPAGSARPQLPTAEPAPVLRPQVPATASAPMRPMAPISATPVSGTPVVVPAGKPAAPAPRPAPAPVVARPVAVAAPAPQVIAEVVGGGLAGKLQGLGLTGDQIQGVLALSREVVEQVVWEVVPMLAETLIQEEIKRLTRD